MSDYEAKQERRRQRLAERAQRKDAEARTPATDPTRSSSTPRWVNLC